MSFISVDSAGTNKTSSCSNATITTFGTVGPVYGGVIAWTGFTSLTTDLLYRMQSQTQAHLTVQIDAEHHEGDN